MTLVSNMSVVVKHFMEFEIYCGKKYNQEFYFISRNKFIK